MPSTYSIGTSGPVKAQSTLGGRAAVYNGTEYQIAYQESGTTVVKYWTAADPTSTWTDESAGCLIPNGQGLSLALAAFSNGDVMVCANGGGSGASYYSQLRAQDGTWGSLTNITTATTFIGVEHDNISVVVDELDNIFWLMKPRVLSGAFYRKLALLKSTQAAPTTWAAQALPMTNAAAPVWTGSCYGMVANGADGIKIFARDGAAGAANILTQLYSPAGNSYSDNGTSIGTTTSTGATTSYMGMTVMMDSGGVFHIAYTVNNNLGATGDFGYAESISGWTSHALTNFNVGTGMIDDADNIIFIERNSGAVSSTEHISRWSNGSNDETAEWFPGYWGYGQPHLGGVEDLWQGEPYWCWINDNSTDLRFGQNTTYDYPAGGDVTPPTGVDITYPTAALTGVSICPSIVCSAGADDTPPISYYFQVDTVNTFDSANLQESGWQSADVTWTPSTQLTTETVYYTRVRARDAVEPPNTGSYATIISFTTGWQWPGMTQPSIVYSGTTIQIPVPVKCRPDSQIADNTNIGLDKSIEVVNLGYPKEMKVTIEPIFDATFKTAIELWFDSHAGQGKSFTFTSGQNTRNDGVWWLKDTELRPKITRGGGRSYQFTFKRVYD